MMEVVIMDWHEPFIVSAGLKTRFGSDPILDIRRAVATDCNVKNVVEVGAQSKEINSVLVVNR